MPKVLLLEEDATYAAEIRRGLARIGFEVTLLRDGSVGLARAVSERFDLILISAELPSINGFRLCNRVKKDENFGDVPLFLMGSVDDELAMHGQLPTRADDYFKKPVVLAELIARIRLSGLHAGGDVTDVTDVTEAKVSLAAVAEMQSKLMEQEGAFATLTRDLATARASATKSESYAKEIERLRAALAEAQRQRSIRPPQAEPGAAAALAALQEKHASALAKLSSALALEKAAADAGRVKLAATEAETHTLGARTKDQERTIAVQKKQLEARAAEGEVARQRLEDMSVQLVRSRPAMERLREEVAAAKSQIAAEKVGAARALEIERERAKVAQTDLERALEEAKATLRAREDEAAAKSQKAVAEVAEQRERAERLEREGAGKLLDRERAAEAIAEERALHAATQSRAQTLEVELGKARESELEREAKIGALERDLADTRRQADETELKRREVTRALSELSHRTSAAAEERGRLAERSAKAEALCGRLEAALASAQRAIEKEKGAHEEAERKKDEEVAAAVARAAEQLQEVKATLTRAYEQRTSALLAERDAKLAAERSRLQQASQASQTDREALERRLDEERELSAQATAAARDAATAAEDALAREREGRKAVEERLAAADASFEQRLREEKSRTLDEHERLKDTATTQLEAALAQANAAKTELAQANERHSREISELERRQAAVIATQGGKLDGQLVLQRAELAATRERYEATLAAWREELDGARSAAERNDARMRELEEQRSKEAAAHAEAGVSSAKKLAEERSAMSKMHVRVLADVRADLELARTAAETAEARARELVTSLDGERELHRAVEGRLEALEAELDSARTRGERAEAARNDAEARATDNARAAVEAAAKVDARNREESVALRAELEQQVRTHAAHRHAAEQRSSELEKLATKQGLRVGELEKRLADAGGGAEQNRDLDQAKIRIRDLEDNIFEAEALRSFESAARASEYEATINALREKLGAAETAREAANDHDDARRRLEIAELEAAWEKRLAAALEQSSHAARASQDAELDALLERFVNVEHERAQNQVAFEKGLRELESTMGETRAQLEAERQAHAATREAKERELDALTAAIAARDDEVDGLEREADAARREVPELEAEIVVLRSELLTLRRELEAERVGARAAGAELARHVDVLARAEKLLDVGTDEPES